jgi:hypothetical protein
MLSVLGNVTEIFGYDRFWPIAVQGVSHDKSAAG